MRWAANADKRLRYTTFNNPTKYVCFFKIGHRAKGKKHTATGILPQSLRQQMAITPTRGRILTKGPNITTDLTRPRSCDSQKSHTTRFVCLLVFLYYRLVQCALE